MSVSEDRLLNRVEVERRVGLKKSALYRLMRDGEFPEPLRISPKAVRWSQREIEAWVGQLPRAKGDGIHRAGNGAG